jgi:hypothetical protein
VASDLSSIPGLLPKHVAVLTGPLQITTALDLVRADRRVVHAAMRRLRPAPTLEDIASWQDHARDLAAAARPGPTGPPGWEQAAAFVVSFEISRSGAEPQRRLVVEQVEQAPPEPRREWPAWSRAAAWTWMLETVEAMQQGGTRPTGHEPPEPAPEPAPESAAEPAPESAPEPTQARPRAPRPITAAIPELVPATGRARRLDAARPAVDIPPGAVLRVTASSEPDLPLQVWLRLRRPGRPSYAPLPAVTAASGEAAEIALDGIPPGEHVAVLAILAPRGKAAAAVIPLPRLRVR